MGLIEDLHAAVADPPAPEFNLDHLVQRGRRRRTTSRTLVGLAACAAVGLIIGGMFAATASRPSGGRTLPVAVAPPLVAPTPRTVTPAATTTEKRLTAALALLPKSLHVPADGTVHFTRMASDHPAPDWFTAGWSYHGIGYTIEVFDEPMPGGNACAPTNRGADGCWERTVDAHGVTYVKSDAAGTASAIYVESFRPDHTHVTVNESASNHHILPATDKAVLIAASHLAALSLHP